MGALIAWLEQLALAEAIRRSAWAYPALEVMHIASFGVLIGSLAWEVLERILARFGVQPGLSLGPIGFDLDVLAFSLVLNPGTILGALGGLLLFHFL